MIAARNETSGEFDAVIFDDGVGEQFLASRLEQILRLGAVLFDELDLENLALADAFDASDVEQFQRALNGFALRIEQTLLQGDDNIGFQDKIP
jgi:hypothetical protein